MRKMARTLTPRAIPTVFDDGRPEPEGEFEVGELVLEGDDEEEEEEAGGIGPEAYENPMDRP